jgi:ubiquinone/menaquinone biosynthesis C-methylase UbiE
MLHSGTELINPFKVLEQAGLQAEMRVADLGCGSLGHFVFPAAQLVGPSGRVYAVDIQKTALQAVERQARQHQFWNVECVWSDIDVLGATRIPGRSLDLTLVVNNFFLSTNRPSLIREALRLTKPGGHILIIEWKKETSVLGPHLSQRMDIDEVRAYVHGVDLAEEKELTVGSDHYGLLYRCLEPDPMAEILSVSSPSDPSFQPTSDM